MSAGSQPRQLAATGVINPQQAPAVAMVTSTSQPFAAVPEGATEAKRRRISPSKAQVKIWFRFSSIYFWLTIKVDPMLQACICCLFVSHGL